MTDTECEEQATSDKHHFRRFPSKDCSTVWNRPTLHEFLILWPPQLLLRYNMETKQVLRSASAAKRGAHHDPASPLLHLFSI